MRIATLLFLVALSPFGCSLSRAERPVDRKDHFVLSADGEEFHYPGFSKYLDGLSELTDGFKTELHDELAPKGGEAVEAATQYAASLEHLGRGLKSLRENVQTFRTAVRNRHDSHTAAIDEKLTNAREASGGGVQSISKEAIEEANEENDTEAGRGSDEESAIMHDNATAGEVRNEVSQEESVEDKENAGENTTVEENSTLAPEEDTESDKEIAVENATSGGSHDETLNAEANSSETVQDETDDEQENNSTATLDEATSDEGVTEENTTSGSFNNETNDEKVTSSQEEMNGGNSSDNEIQGEAAEAQDESDDNSTGAPAQDA